MVTVFDATVDACAVPNDGSDVVILTGWQSKMLIQAWWAALRLRVPRVVRGESNAMRRRGSWKRAAHRFWLRGFDEFLAIGPDGDDQANGEGSVEQQPDYWPEKICQSG